MFPVTPVSPRRAQSRAPSTKGTMRGVAEALSCQRSVSTRQRTGRRRPTGWDSTKRAIARASRITASQSYRTPGDEASPACRTPHRHASECNRRAASSQWEEVLPRHHYGALSTHDLEQHRHATPLIEPRHRRQTIGQRPI